MATVPLWPVFLRRSGSSRPWRRLQCKMARPNSSYLAFRETRRTGNGCTRHRERISRSFSASESEWPATQQGSATASYKWLMGDFGLGFLYAKKSSNKSCYGQLTAIANSAASRIICFPMTSPLPPPLDWEQYETAAGYFDQGTQSRAGNASLLSAKYPNPWRGNTQEHAQSLIQRSRRENSAARS
jgi:hypothetical protein